MTSSWFEGSGSGSSVDVAEMFEGLGVQGVIELVEAGALVSIGKTTDGGALGVTVTCDGRFRREYFRKQDEMLAWIAEALPAVHEAKGSARPSSGGGTRSRGRQTR